MKRGWHRLLASAATGRSGDGRRSARLAVVAPKAQELGAEAKMREGAVVRHGVPPEARPGARGRQLEGAAQEGQGALLLGGAPCGVFAGADHRVDARRVV